MNQVLSATQATQFQKAMQHLIAGKSQTALGMARDLASEQPGAADAHQLLGMCLGEQGFPAEASSAFERALSLLPGNRVVLKNFTAFLVKQGKLFRSRHQFDAATAFLQRAVKLMPDHRFAWAELGMALRLTGDIDGALSAFDKAVKLGGGTPALRNAINGTLQDAGQLETAVRGAQQLVNENPGYAGAQETLANILWENRQRLPREDDPFRLFRRAVKQQPENTELHISFVRMLLSAKYWDEALNVLLPLRLRQPDNPVLSWYFAEALENTGEVEAASRLFSSIASKWNNNAGFLNAYTRHAFRRKEIDLANECASRAVVVDPGNQEAWANLGIFWRLQNDAREYWLFDYENLIEYIQIAPPSGYASNEEFLTVLQKKLESMHQVSGEPINQSVRGGSQTPGRLFGRKDPVLNELWLALQSAVENWLGTLPRDAKHPFLSRNLKAVRSVGSWSVRLASAGRHSNHIHNQGWLSSAFHVSLPHEVQIGDKAQNGWLQFGSPLESLGLELPARRLIQPKAGCLALFPSYMWHGTVPFTGEQARLTIAFDMQPTAGTK
ncbi:putative 2OG-Fe(II) oxygenase [Microbulbifer pacificus]|uniref:2OG-Fe(II) oxygenase n=1 Tax=Microbulbifer pacificus TaxID=407164 RepID=A0AAU0MX62_9GAMM|nr:putative 2OG-Fe(II) oxygenase [Microbulbifer pacificus]WOX04786.1 putative 2OG-Fe(II) oxygenase [Microbulbifer pacificus]